MSDLVWPLDLRPASQEFYIQTLSTVWASPYTGQNQVLERDGARWVSRLSSDDAGRNPTRPPRRSEWSLELFEVLA